MLDKTHPELLYLEDASEQQAQSYGAAQLIASLELMGQKYDAGATVEQLAALAVEAFGKLDYE